MGDVLFTSSCSFAGDGYFKTEWSRVSFLLGLRTRGSLYGVSRGGNIGKYTPYSLRFALWIKCRQETWKMLNFAQHGNI